MEIARVEARAGGERCPYCRDDLGGVAVVRCPGCGVGHHAACRAEMAHCGTIGCTGRAGRGAPPEGATAAPLRVEQPLRGLPLAAAALLLLLGGGLFALTRAPAPPPVDPHVAAALSALGEAQALRRAGRSADAVAVLAPVASEEARARVPYGLAEVLRCTVHDDRLLAERVPAWEAALSRAGSLPPEERYEAIRALREEVNAPEHHPASSDYYPGEPSLSEMRALVDAARISARLALPPDRREQVEAEERAERERELEALLRSITRGDRR
ncbi:MAG: hypothetical protein M9894_03080 [Planctomycetes bacterium]|nr:hypothetical protein [Planctomycetota bacterium]